MKIDPTETTDRGDRSPADATAGPPSVPWERVERLDVAHIGRVVRKWRLLVIVGALFIVGATVALLRLTPPAYEAETVLLFDQPALVATGDEGLATAQKLLNLMPTYARIATSDPVLRSVQERVGTDAPLDDLRSRLASAPVPDTLAISIVASDDQGDVAERLAAATAQALIDRIDEVQEETDVPAAARFIISPLLEPEAERPSRSEVRTIVFAAILGVLVMIGVAFFLEYIEPAPDDSIGDWHLPLGPRDGN